MSDITDAFDSFKENSETLKDVVEGSNTETVTTPGGRTLNTVAKEITDRVQAGLSGIGVTPADAEMAVVAKFTTAALSGLDLSAYTAGTIIQDSSLDTLVTVVDESGTNKLRYEGLSFGTVAEMETWLSAIKTKLVDGHNLCLTGYHETGDCYPRTLRFDAASTGTADTGTVFGAGTGRLIDDRWNGNCKAFGAKGDLDFDMWRNHSRTEINATTDDTDAINAAIAAAQRIGIKRVRLPRGIYRITSALKIRGAIPVDLIGDMPPFAISDGATDQDWQNLRSGTCIYRDFGPGASGPSDTFAAIEFTGAITTEELTAVGGGTAVAWDSPQAFLKEATIRGIFFNDIQTTSETTMLYDGTTHLAPAIDMRQAQWCRIQRCLFNSLGQAIAVRGGWDCYIEDNVFACGKAYNSSTAHANSTGALRLHRGLSGSYHSINVLSVWRNIFEGNYIMDWDAGGDASDGDTDTQAESGDGISITRDNRYKVGGQAEYMRSRRARVYRMRGSIYISGALKNTNAANSITSAGILEIAKVYGGTYSVGGSLFPSSHDGITEVTSLVTVSGATDTFDLEILSDFSDDGTSKFTGAYQVAYGDFASQGFCNVIDGRSAKSSEVVSPNIPTIHPEYIPRRLLDGLPSVTFGGSAGIWIPINSTFAPGTGDFSIEAVVDFPTSYTQEAIFRFASNSSKTAFGFSLRTSAAIPGDLRAEASGNTKIFEDHSILDGERHHLVFTRSGNVASIYLDGNLYDQIDDADFAENLTGLLYLVLGQYGTTSYRSGDYCRFRMFNFALSHTQVLRVLETERCPSPYGLYADSDDVCMIDLDFGAGGNCLKDLSGNRACGWMDTDISNSNEPEYAVILTPPSGLSGSDQSVFSQITYPEIPAGWYIDSIVAHNAGSASAEITISNGSGGTTIVATDTIAAGASSVLTVAAPHDPISAGADLYIDATSWTDVTLHLKAVIRPITVN